MKIVIITNSDHFDIRADMIRNNLEKNNEVTVFSTDFVHAKKTTRTESKYRDFILFPTKKYKKNLSVERLLSHWDYAKRVFREVEKINPDLLYVLIPSNSNAYRAVKYCKKHKNTKLIIDIIDMWPESFPLKKFEKLPPFKIWRNLRDKSLEKADYVIAECGLYFERLGKRVEGIPKEVLYFAKQGTNTDKTPNLPEGKINLCYLGAVNNIIDIPFISKMISEISKIIPTILHIIGSGERMEEFKEAAKNAGAEVIDHGIIYDANEKQKIFNICHFGINAMKDTVCVGLTMKSVDYFDGGLPILNNIKGDTTTLVEKYSAGFNVTEETMDSVAEKIFLLKNEDFENMRKNAISLFDQNLSTEVFYRELQEIKDKLEIV